MGRVRRLWHPNFYYHVVMRGNNRRKIFAHDADIQEFFRILQYVHSKYPFTIIAYCVMTNHYHLLIRSKHAPLSKVMMLINRRYADYMKRKYHYTGHLYEGRFYSHAALTPNAIVAISRYIHRNPIETTIPIVERMEYYPHSSFAFYFGNRISPYSFMDVTLLPSIKTDYINYCEENHVEEQHI